MIHLFFFARATLIFFNPIVVNFDNDNDDVIINTGCQKRSIKTMSDFVMILLWIGVFPFFEF